MPYPIQKQGLFKKTESHFYIPLENKPLIRDLFYSYNCILPASLKDASEKRKIEFMGGRICAYHALKLYNKNTTTMNMGNNGQAQWPHNFVGSISHTYQYACAVANRTSIVRSLGIDCEKISNFRSFDSIKKLTTNKNEHLFFEDSEKKYRNALLIFSIKESIYKALSQLSYSNVGFMDFEVQSIEEPTTSSDIPRNWSGILLVDKCPFIKKGRIITGKWAVDQSHIFTGTEL